MGQYLKTVDYLAGRGFLYAEGVERRSVSYSLHVRRDMIRSKLGGPDLAGAFDIMGVVRPDEPFPLLQLGLHYTLELIDGIQVGALVSRVTQPSHEYPVVIENDEELTKRYSEGE